MNKVIKEKIKNQLNQSINRIIKSKNSHYTNNDYIELSDIRDYLKTTFQHSSNFIIKLSFIVSYSGRNEALRFLAIIYSFSRTHITVNSLDFHTLGVQDI